MRFPLASTVIVVIAALTAAGCILPDEMKQLEQDVSQMRRELDDVRQDQADAISELGRIEEQVAERLDDPESVSREDFADLAVQVQQIERDLSNVDQRVSDLNGRLADVAEDASQAREYARTTPAEPGIEGDAGNRTDPMAIAGGEMDYPEAQPDPQALYNAAYADYSKGNYELAISGFQEYQEKFSDKPNADNALYWVAECRFSQGDFGGAIRGFDDMLSRYPDSDKAASANLKKALAYLEQNDIQRAILQLRYVHGSYSGTDEARIARDKLASLGAPV